mgnify:CR=1 FL=1
MKRIWNRAIIGAVLGVGLALSAPLRAETLPDALIAAYRNSNLLEQNRALLRVRDEDVASAVAALRPVVDFVARASYTYTEFLRPVGGVLRTGVNDGTRSSLGLTVDLMLYDGGATEYRIAAAKELVLATRQALIDVEHRVLLSAVAAYMDVKLQIETVALRQSNVRVIERELSAARDRFELGEITRTDVAIAEARLAGARANLSAAEGDLAVARETYKLAIGHYPQRLAAAPALPRTADNVAQARDVARRTHHAIKQAQHEVAAAELEMLRAAAVMRPRVGIGANLGIADSGLQNHSLSLTMSKRLYQGGAMSAAYRQAMARRDAGRAGLHQRVAEVDQAVGDSWARLAVARARIEASERQIRAARTAYEGVREEATLGARTTLDVLNAEQELLDAQAQRLQAVTAQYTATYALLSSMGLLTVEHLRLGIPTYDPAAYHNAVRNAPATSSQGARLDRVLRAIGN